MVFNTTFNNRSVKTWQSVLLVEETGGRGEKKKENEQTTIYKTLHIKLKIE